MAKSTGGNISITGMERSDAPRYHFDIYAILEGAQELYFGSEVAVNVNLVETVKVKAEEDLEKCYISPTKRRGVERRTLIWAPVSDGQLLGDRLGCGIPSTCAKQSCPICSVFGALRPTDSQSFIGRLTHGGGVAIQPLLPERKQRAMHPARMVRTEKGDETPMPFTREYNEPALHYPIYNHCLSITEREFAAVAYAFLNALSRIGAGNPKGVRIAEDTLLHANEPLLVMDRYLTPLGKRPIISPTITDVGKAKTAFSEAALSVYGEPRRQAVITEGDFQRWVGDAAMHELQRAALAFTRDVLQSPAGA